MIWPAINWQENKDASLPPQKRKENLGFKKLRVKNSWTICESSGSEKRYIKIVLVL